MIGTRSATTALILVASLAPVAFAQQQPAKPAATPQPQKPAAAPAKPAATAAAPAAAAGDAQPTLLGQYGDWGAYTASPGPATGSGISASTRLSGVPKRWQRMAFTGARAARTMSARYSTNDGG